MIELSVINKSTNPLPKHETEESAGVDLRAFLEESVLLLPMQRLLINTGLFLALPKGYEAQIRPRSGLAYKHGVTVLNSPGTIDSDYRGEVKILLVNLSKEPFEISNGERIAQMVVSKHEQVEFSLKESLDETARGTGGYGHTGK